MLKTTSEGKVTISNSNIEQSKKSVALVADNNLRKKVFASFVAINALIKYMDANDINLDVHKSLSRIHTIIENLDLSNLMYNDVQIDIRVILDGDNIYIPKAHFRHEVIPDVYVAAKIDKNFTNIEFLGFIESSMLDLMVDLKEYYSVPVEQLKPISEFPDTLKQIIPAKKFFDSAEHRKVQDLFINYFDGKISKVEKIYLIRHLFYCSECRKKFVNFYDFDIVGKQIQRNPEVLNGSNVEVETNNIQPQSTLEEFLTAADDEWNEDEFFDELRNDLEERPESKPLFKNKFKKVLGVKKPAPKSKFTDRPTMQARTLKVKKEEFQFEKSIPAPLPQEIRQQPQPKAGAAKIEPEIKNTKPQTVTPKSEAPLQKTNTAKSVIVQNNEVSGSLPIAPSAPADRAEEIVKLFNKGDKAAEKAELQESSENGKAQTTSKLYSKDNAESSSLIKLSLAICAVIVSLIVFAMCGYNYFKSNPLFAPKKDTTEASTEILDAGALTATDQSEPLLADQGPKDINKAMVDGFSDMVSAIAVTKILWEVSPTYAQNETFNTYLQNAGLSIQNNLQNDLMNVTDYIALNNSIKVSFKLLRDQNIKDFKVEASSGSDEIDKVVAESIKTTLKYYAYPNFDPKVNSIDFKLVVEF